MVLSARFLFLSATLWNSNLHVLRRRLWCVLWSETLPALCRKWLPGLDGEHFHASDCLHCNSEIKIKQVISVPSIPQKLEGCKQ